MGFYLVTNDPLDLARLTGRVMAARYGAVATFLGTVRSPNDGMDVDYIDYEGYEPMIERQMGIVTRELRSRFDLGRVAMAHRLGRLHPGEISIAIIISSEHRKDALGACRVGIDRCKELLPVWKYEVTAARAGWVSGSSRASEPL